MDLERDAAPLARRCLAGGLLALAFGGAHAQATGGKYADAAGPEETHFHGLVLGQAPTGMAQCAFDATLGKYRVDLDQNPQTCYLRDEPGSQAPLLDETVNVVFRQGGVPGVAKANGHVRATLMGGRVERVTVLTGGLPTQEMNYGWLRAYFGAPSTGIKVHPLRTAQGQVLGVWEVSWNRPKQAKVEFMAVGDPNDLETGIVVISSQRALDQETK